MSLSQFVSKKFGKLEASSISGGAQTATVLKGANITSATGVTISASQLLSGCIVRSGNGASQTDELPSAADLIAQLNILTNTQASVGMSATCQYLLVGNPITISGGTDSTIGGTTTFTTGTATAGARQLIATLASLSGTSGSVYYFGPAS